jgi:glycosyltransferase involved in cell wall biosynthesis
MLSVLIPARNERFLGRTVADVVAKARGPIEVLVNVDNDPGYAQESLPELPGVTYFHPGRPLGMRQGLRALAGAAKGQWLMKLDGHCLLDEGFDLKLTADCPDNCLVIPRRYRLDEAAWQRKAPDPEPPIDYEHFIYPRKFQPPSLHGYRWNERTHSRAGIAIDDTLSFQGSCWCMDRRHWDRHAFFTDPGYENLPQQEAEELGLTTRYHGGRVLVNKNTWFAHWFKGKANGIGYRIGKPEARRCYQYAYQLWVHQRRDFFEQVIESFWPVPEWPDNWRERLYGLEAAQA